jgi:hypothetical protein
MIASIDARTCGLRGVAVEDQRVEQLLSAAARAEEHEGDERTKPGRATVHHENQSYV